MPSRPLLNSRSPGRLMPLDTPAVPSTLGLHLALLALVGGLLPGCSWFRSPAIKADRVDIIATPKANNNSPVAVDVVVVYDDAVLQKLAQVPAAEWFDKRTQFQLDAPTQIQVVAQLEVVPSSHVSVDLSSVERRKATGGLAFINYPTPGDHRLRIDQLEQIRIELLDKDFRLLPPEE
jgi:type VI secretion system protein